MITDIMAVDTLILHGQMESTVECEMGAEFIWGSEG